MLVSLRQELRPMLRLAGPVVMAEIGWMSMGIVDTIMVGPLGPAAIGAVGIGTSVLTAIAIFGMGLMLGLDALVSSAYGARRLDECQRWLHHGLVLSGILILPLMAIGAAASLSMPSWGLHPDILQLARPYYNIVLLGMPALVLYAAGRRYLQGLHCATPVMIALITANLVNVFANWVLIYGNLGFPAMGTAGSAWATCLARGYMALFVILAIAWVHRRRGELHPTVGWAVDTGRMRRLMALGLPAASQVTLEVGVFAAVTALAGRLDPVSSASHQIALNIAALAFMVPLGLSSAAAVRVGYAIGAARLQQAVVAGWTALAAGAAVMTAIGLLFISAPELLLRAFSTDPRVIAQGVVLLAIAAAFQLFDGTQAVATGVLRGIGDTRTPMVINAVGHWALGLPVGYLLCFTFGWGVSGLWIGLSVGLTFTALALTIAWARRSTRLVARSAAAR